MAWPTPQDYNEAIQDPRLCFSDPELKTGRVAVNPLGLPKPYSGGFATVYKLDCGARTWAVRCFQRELVDQQRRYAIIDQYLRSVRLLAMVGFEFLPQGMRIAGNWYPVLKMEWVEGQLLNEYVAAHLQQPQTLVALARHWADLLASLRSAGIAHGDLQHGNVLVAGGTLKLIDYDGMFVPGLAGFPSREEGHRNYQHPLRDGADFGPYLDNFSAWVVFLSISALAAQPSLWHIAGGGDEHLLLRREDFIDPASSKMLRELDNVPSPEVQALAAHFRAMLRLPMQQVPGLDGVVVPQVTPKPAAGRPNWLDDYVRPEPQDVPQPQRAASSAAGPTWLFDHLGEPSARHDMWVGVPLGFARAIVLSAALVIACAVVAFGAGLVSAQQSIWLSVVAASLSCFALRRRFGSLALHEERRDAQARLSEVELKMSQTELDCDQLLKERSRIDQAIGESDRKLRGILKKHQQEERLMVDRERGLQEHQQSERVAAEQRHDAAERQRERRLHDLERRHKARLDAIDTRRRSLDQKESLAVVDRQRQGQAQLDSLRLKGQSLGHQQDAELAQALAGLREWYVRGKLEQASMRSFRGPGIGDRLKERLRWAGVKSAADVTLNKVRSVEGIGYARGQALLAWRAQLERSAGESAPRSLPQDVQNTIGSKYTSLRQAIEKQMDIVEHRLIDEVDRIKREYFDQKRQADAERASAKVEADIDLQNLHQLHDVSRANELRALEQLQQRQRQEQTAHDGDRARLHAQHQSERERAEDEHRRSTEALKLQRGEVDRRMGGVQQALFQRRFEVCRLKNEVAWYCSVTMRAYTLRVLFGNRKRGHP